MSKCGAFSQITRIHPCDRTYHSSEGTEHLSDAVTSDGISDVSPVSNFLAGLGLGNGGRTVDGGDSLVDGSATTSSVDLLMSVDVCCGEEELVLSSCCQTIKPSRFTR